MTTTATAPLASISPRSLADSLERDPAAPLIDVRTSLEYREVHVPQAENIPLDELDPAALAKRFDRGDQPVYVICQSGGRGAKACERLRAVLKAPVVNVAGGTAAWEAAGLPVVRGERVISLERQVRIAAGALVLAGALLAVFAHPAFVWFCALIGAGLVFAGVTNFCGMGLVLAKAPWNRRACAGGSCQGS